jgi:hypothetical protein
MSINDEYPKQEHLNEAEEDKNDKLVDMQLKVYNDVSYAEEFLKKL